jgi:hypothetical protein
MALCAISGAKSLTERVPGWGRLRSDTISPTITIAAAIMSSTKMGGDSREDIQK